MKKKEEASVINNIKTDTILTVESLTERSEQG